MRVILPSRLPPLLAAAALGAACNQPPSAPTVSLTPEAPTTLDDLEAIVSAEDPNGDDVSFIFRWSVDGTPVPDLTFPVVPASRTTRDEVWSVVVIPTDGAAEGPSATAEVTILNAPPRVTLQLGPETPATDDDLQAVATVVDDDDDTVTLAWSWTVNGRDANISADEVQASATARGETWEVVVTPNDGTVDGDAATAQVVIQNSAPKLTQVSLSPADIFDARDGALAVVTANYLASDLDEDDLTADVTWYVDGVETAGNGDGTLDGRSFRKGQELRADVTVRDGSLADGPVSSDPVRVQNSPPSVLRASLDPATLLESSVAVVLPEGWSDEDEDPPAYRYRWLVNGRDAGTGDRLDGSSWKKGDKVVCELTPDDGEAYGALVRTPERVVQNTAPVLDSVALSPDPVRTDDTLTATPTGATDDDGDVVTITYAWTVNGTAVSASGSALGGSSFKKGDRVAVTATPGDGTANGTAASASILVSNSAPVVSSLVISPSPVRTNDTAGASVSVSDPDGDTLTTTISWSVNGKVVASGTTLSGSTYFAKGDKVEASATTTDGVDTSAPRVASLTVANTAPVAPELSMSPSSTPKDTDDIQCRISKAATDADADTLTYSFAWTKNGTTFTGTTRTTYAGDTVPASATAPGDKFECTVTASDGTDSSPAVKASATVPSTSREWTFTDTSADDVTDSSLATFFGTTPASSDYIYFSVDGGSYAGAWCAERADWYASEYLKNTTSGSSSTSGSWNKWSYNAGTWSSPTTSGYSNIWSGSCSGVPYDWCSEWGLGGKYLAVMPGNGAGSAGESYANTWSSGGGWKVTIRVGPSRSAACGF